MLVADLEVSFPGEGRVGEGAGHDNGPDVVRCAIGSATPCVVAPGFIRWQVVLQS